MPQPEIDFLAILRVLLATRVEFVVVGGVGAALHGAPVTTYDLDVVHARDAENAARLLEALAMLDAWFREHPARRPRPVLSDLRSPGHLLLMTRHGPLDLLGTVTGGLDYERLAPRSRPIEIGEGLSARVLDLEALIELKAATGREKDLAALPILRRTLEEREREG